VSVGVGSATTAAVPQDAEDTDEDAALQQCSVALQEAHDLITQLEARDAPYHRVVASAPIAATIGGDDWRRGRGTVSK